MNGVRIGIVASLLLCIWLAWPKADGGTPPRPIMVKSALKDAQDPIVLLGDETIRKAKYPRQLCKRPVIDAGIDGSTTASGLDGMLKKAMGAKQATMIVVSLGRNDANENIDIATFRQNYMALLAALKPMTKRLAVIAIENAASDYNAALISIANSASASVIDGPAAIAKELCP